MDIAMTGYFSFANTAKIYKNDGNGKFTDIGVNILGSGYGSIAWGDCDNDGYLDLATATNSGVRIYKNNGNGVFADMNANLTSAYAPIAWGDYDNDGDIDLLAGKTVYRNDT